MKASDIFVQDQAKVDNVVEVVVQEAVEEEVREVVPEVIKASQNGCPPPIFVTQQQQSVPSLQFDLVEDLVGSSDEEEMKHAEDHESGLPDSVRNIGQDLKECRIKFSGCRRIS
jgi:hypothetical protein